MSETVFTMMRYEYKYILNKSQLAYLKQSIKDKMSIDQYGLTSIASIYFDTPDYRLIRNSIEKPPFKEKIRLRSYGLSKDGDGVFLELKRKADGVVYKRRVLTSEEAVKRFFNYEGDIAADGQIAREISYFRNFYKDLSPALMIIYDREAYYTPDSQLRLTIDNNPRYRSDKLDLHTSMDGENLLPFEGAILEIKVQDAMPMWLSKILSEGKIYKTSFSKVGEAYKKQMKKFIEERNA